MQQESKLALNPAVFLTREKRILRINFNQLIKLVLHIVFFFSLISTWAQQNLVPNSSFEEYNWCPNTANGFYINSCKYWTSPTLGTPDYFNACSLEYDVSLQSYLYSVPQNYAGSQAAHSGSAYGFFGFAQNEVGSAPYSEYLQIELTQQLTVGKFYEVRFYINNARSSYCINSVSALFTSEELNLNTDALIPLSPQISSNQAIFFCDTNNWQEVKGVFSAKGGESFMTIGVFKELPELKVTDYQGNPILDFPSSYLYVDDVSVIEKDLELANVFTPDGDGINDTYILNLEGLGAKRAEIYNRWGNIIAQGETSLIWDGTFNGQDCTDGVYFVRVQFENNTVSGFIHLVK